MWKLNLHKRDALALTHNCKTALTSLSSWDHVENNGFKVRSYYLQLCCIAAPHPLAQKLLLHYGFPWKLNKFILTWCGDAAVTCGSGVTDGGRGAECPQRLLTGKFLLPYLEKRGKEKREKGWKLRRKEGKFLKGRWKIGNRSRKKKEK